MRQLYSRPLWGNKYTVTSFPLGSDEWALAALCSCCRHHSLCVSIICCYAAVITFNGRHWQSWLDKDGKPFFLLLALSISDNMEATNIIFMEGSYLNVVAVNVKKNSRSIGTYLKKILKELTESFKCNVTSAANEVFPHHFTSSNLTRSSTSHHTPQSARGTSTHHPCTNLSKSTKILKLLNLILLLSTDTLHHHPALLKVNSTSSVQIKKRVCTAAVRAWLLRVRSSMSDFTITSVTNSRRWKGPDETMRGRKLSRCCCVQ